MSGSAFPSQGREGNAGHPVCAMRNVVSANELRELYDALAAAPAESEEFELLHQQFNRACDEDPKAVVAALDRHQGRVS